MVHRKRDYQPRTRVTFRGRNSLLCRDSFSGGAGKRRKKTRKMIPSRFPSPYEKTMRSLRRREWSNRAPLKTTPFLHAVVPLRMLETKLTGSISVSPSSSSCSEWKYQRWFDLNFLRSVRVRVRESPSPPPPPPQESLFPFITSLMFFFFNYQGYPSTKFVGTHLQRKAL